MKLLRAIGGFFAKIGRWIANTAWIQPLLIVGGIFAVIFSIPYIKTAIENAQIDNTDYDYEYYKGYALGLETGGQADKLFGYLETEDYTKINEEFGEKFFISFVKEDCAYCKEAVDGYKNFNSNFSKFEADGSFKLHTILVDKTADDDDDKYLAKDIINEHNEFFDLLAADYGEDSSKYILYKNLPAQFDNFKTKLNALPSSTSETSEGIDTPITLMYDYNAMSNGMFNVCGITAVFFNYIDLMADYDETNEVTKGFFLRDCWKYERVFSEDYLANK